MAASFLANMDDSGSFLLPPNEINAYQQQEGEVKSFLEPMSNSTPLPPNELVARRHRNGEFGSYLDPMPVGKSFGDAGKERPARNFWSSADLAVPNRNGDITSPHSTSRRFQSFLLENKELLEDHLGDDCSLTMATAADNGGYIPPHRRKMGILASPVEGKKPNNITSGTAAAEVANPTINGDSGNVNPQNRSAKNSTSLANGWAEQPFTQDVATEWHQDTAVSASIPTRGSGSRNKRNIIVQGSGYNKSPTDATYSRGSTRGSGRGNNRGRGRGSPANTFEPHANGTASVNNTRAHGWPKVNAIPKRRNDAWAGKNDIPKLCSNRHKVAWGLVSGSTDPDSNRPSSGWGTRRKRTDGQGPPLADFSGNWAPAPVDWDSRPGFRDGQSAIRIEEWVEHSMKELSMVESPSIQVTVDGHSFNAPEADRKDLHLCLQGEAAPRHWIPQTIESKTAKCFWKDYLRSKEPEPVDEEDIVDVQPWWQTYQANGCSFLAHRLHPHVAGPDPTETEDERLQRDNDRGSHNVKEDRLAYERAKKVARLQRQAQKQQRIKQQAKAYVQDQRPDKTKPGLHIVLRSATVDDAKAIRDIYNHYVDHTVVVQEIERCTEQNMAQRIRTSKASKLPFIVAYQRGEKLKGRNQRYNNGEDLYTPDRFLGFAYANDYFDAKGVWRFTATLEIYVGMNTSAKGIGSCLLDKMMGLLDLTYVERRGYETVGEELDGAGAARNLTTLLVQYLYDAKQPERMEWVSSWLQRKAGFEKAANLKAVAHKFDKMLNFAILQRTNGVDFDPTNPPITM